METDETMTTDVVLAIKRYAMDHKDYPGRLIILDLCDTIISDRNRLTLATRQWEGK